jgi:rubrerythrin
MPNGILSPDQKIMDILAGAIEDERESESYYRRLRRLAKDPSDQETLRLIQMDEHKHAKYFEDIYHRLTGRTPQLQAQPSQRCLGYSYAQECEKSMYAALEAVDFYRRIYTGFSNTEVRDMLLEIILDEQNTAIKLQHLYSKNMPAL